MNQDGATDPISTIDRVSSSPHEDTITNHEHIHRKLGDDSNISKNNTPNLLSTCAKSDKGGGVGLNHEVFAIYSTAALPPLWTDILHSSAAGNTSSTIERLHVLADAISASLPIYTSRNDISHSSPDHGILEIHSLNTTTTTTTTQPPSSTHPGQSPIHRKKPHFLINAALHTKHCIIGQGSKTETLLVVLRRPWCVLEICLSNIHDIEALGWIRAFALFAQEVDHSGYGTAVFLLGVEIEARRRRRRRRQTLPQGEDDCLWWDRREMNSSGRVYELCNTAVFIPSLSSFNSFWIRLICVCAIELGIGFSCMIYMLCEHQQPTAEYDKQDARKCRSDSAVSKLDLIESLRHDGRRHSSAGGLYPYSRLKAEEAHGDVVQRMLNLYKHVLRRTEDHI